MAMLKTRPTVFYKLGDLAPGNLVYVTRADHWTVVFRVTSVALYPPVLPEPAGVRVHPGPYIAPGHLRRRLRRADPPVPGPHHRVRCLRRGALRPASGDPAITPAVQAPGEAGSTGTGVGIVALYRMRPTRGPAELSQVWLKVAFSCVRAPSGAEAIW